MKSILYSLLLLLLTNTSFCQEVFDEASMTLEAGKIINEANSRIVRSDTVIKSIKVDTTEVKGTSIIMTHINSKWKQIKHYDSNNNLVMVQSKGIDPSPGNTDLAIYDTNNNFTFECHNDPYGATWFVALNKYNDKGILTEKKFWNEKYIGKMVYDNPKKPKKYTFYNADGKKVRSWRKSKRKIPYKMPKYIENPSPSTEEKTN